jgi:hypothetical protein
MMFQKILIARSKQLFGSAPAIGFKARAPERDAETDHSRIESMLAAIEDALLAAESEHEGLRKRVDNVLSRAAVTFGNGNDEYLSRDPLDSHHQDLFAADVTKGEQRLQELAASIPHIKFLRAALLSRFPAVKSPA